MSLSGELIRLLNENWKLVDSDVESFTFEHPQGWKIVFFETGWDFYHKDGHLAGMGFIDAFNILRNQLDRLIV